MNIIIRILGEWGVILFIGIIVFIPTFKRANKLFTWIEDQTFGTRNMIMAKLELLFIKVEEIKVTYILIGATLGAFVLFSVGLGLITGKWLIAILIGLLFAYLTLKIPKPILNYFVQKRHTEYGEQMVDALTLLANGIRAGLTVPQSIGMVVDEMPAPISEEFNLLLQQNKIGVALEDCFDNLGKRVSLQDNDMFVSSVNILRETGGNLAETFDTIVDVIRERVRLKQKVEQFTAQGFFQGIVIAGMPYGIAIIYFITDPNSILRLFQHPLGILMVIIAIVLDAIGFVVIMNIVKIKT